MSFVETTTNSAPEFYEKLGYSLIGTIADYPIANETFYLYKKRLEEVN
jgi:ribosomal protein S18 acetylase RimI-like enzyme